MASRAGPTKDTFSKQADSFTFLTNDNRSLVMASHKIVNSFNKNISVINAQSFLVNDKLNVVQPDRVDSQGQTLENSILNELIKSAGDNHNEKKLPYIMDILNMQRSLFLPLQTKLILIILFYIRVWNK